MKARRSNSGSNSADIAQPSVIQRASQRQREARVGAAIEGDGGVAAKATTGTAASITPPSPVTARRTVDLTQQPMTPESQFREAVGVVRKYGIQPQFDDPKVASLSPEVRHELAMLIVSSSMEPDALAKPSAEARRYQRIMDYTEQLQAKQLEFKEKNTWQASDSAGKPAEPASRASHRESINLYAACTPQAAVAVTKSVIALANQLENQKGVIPTAEAAKIKTLIRPLANLIVRLAD